MSLNDLSLKMYDKDVHAFSSLDFKRHALFLRVPVYKVRSVSQDDVLRSKLS